LQDLTLRPLKDDEVLVQIIATGICHTDLFVTSIPVERGAMTGVTYPKVVGHEGELAVSSSTPAVAAEMGMTEPVTLCMVLTVLEQALAT
jgi:D-arabinose 1-dehydrogenase-like Zn-dependent alcohol dehydrogenase